MGLQLRIKNIGVCDYNSLLVFGATGNRYSTNKMTIGTFGSGGKHGIGALLRAGINPQVFCGLTKLSYFSKPKRFKKASGGDNMQQQVCCIVSGTLPAHATEDERMGTKELGFTLDFGSADWNTPALACREFVSNAIDGQIEMTGDFAGVEIDIVDDSKVRAKDGYTQVFLPICPEVQQFYNDLGKWFLHFSEPDVVRNGTKILPKGNRNTTDKKRAVIFRRGVRVREFMASDKESLFDYNLEVQLNEARTFNDWEAKREVGVALRNAPRDILAVVLNALNKGDGDKWELTLDEYGLMPQSWETEDVKVVEARKGEWQAAAALVIGDEGVFCDDVKCVSQMVEKKGYAPVPVKNKAWLDAFKANGIRTDTDILTRDDKAGRTFLPPTEAVQQALDIVWNGMEKLGMTSGKERPACGCFTEPIDCEGRAMGLYRPENKTVYAHTDYTENLDEQLVYILTEEVLHHISGATDYSRDFQTLQTQVIGRLFWEAIGKVYYKATTKPVYSPA